MTDKRKAKSLAGSEYLDVTKCNKCGGNIAWATSKRTGKRYPCEVVSKQSNTPTDVLRAVPWQPHTPKLCAERIERVAEQTKQWAESDAAAEQPATLPAAKRSHYPAQADIERSEAERVQRMFGQLGYSEPSAPAKRMDDIQAMTKAAEYISPILRKWETIVMVYNCDQYLICDDCGKQLVSLMLAWSDDMPHQVTTGERNSTQRFGGLRHLDGSPGHIRRNSVVNGQLVEQTPTDCFAKSVCPKCKSFDSTVTRQLAYGDETTCTTDGCDYKHYYSIGD